MRPELSEEQVRYVMSKIEADVVAGDKLADSVERELDLTLMDNEDREPVTVAILCVRHPDASNEFTVSAPEGVDVLVISADYGSGFDGQPRSEDEAEYAVEMAQSLTDEAAGLPDGDKVKEAVAGITAELWEDASHYLSKARLAELEEDPDAPDDGKVLVAGILYDAETGEEAVPQ